MITVHVETKSALRSLHAPHQLIQDVPFENTWNRGKVGSEEFCLFWLDIISIMEKKIIHLTTLHYSEGSAITMTDYMV